MKTLSRSLIAVLAGLLLANCVGTARPLPTPTAVLAPTPAPLPTRAPEPLIPTLPAPASPTPVPTPVVGPTATPLVAPPLANRWRFGVGLAYGKITDYDLSRLLPGWYLDWSVRIPPATTLEVAYAPMVRVSEDGFSPNPTKLLEAIDAMPGALWLLGNEPDVAWQDNATPETYARHYHALYTLIKGRDPSARVAIGGLSQPTALRIRYLERVLAAYEREFGAPMPVDVWNIHNFILREEADSWGVGIPPGFDDTQGELYEIADHDDMEIFAQQIINFRYWMWKQGQREKPLIISEYGILMPPDYGFPAEAVKQFMWDSFDFFLNARDEEIGYPADDNRLVQQWCWYSLGDTLYYTSNLFDPQTFVITPLGEAFGEYIRAH